MLPRPIFIIFERHWDSIAKQTLNKLLPELSKKGYDTLCLEYPQNITSKEFESRVDGTIALDNQLYSDANKYLTQHGVKLDQDLGNMSYSKLSDLMKYHVSSQRYEEVAERIRHRAADLQMKEILNTTKKLSMQVEGIDVDSSLFDPMILTNLFDRNQASDKIWELRNTTIFKHLEKLQTQRKGVVLLCGVKHANDLMSLLKDKNIIYHFIHSSLRFNDALNDVEFFKKDKVVNDKSILIENDLDRDAFIKKIISSIEPINLEKKKADSTPSFIMTGMNKTGRFDPATTDKNIIGLGTVGLRTCVSVIIYGENSKRISLTHHVGGLERDYSSILKEIEWVGGPYIIRLVKNTVGMREGMLEISEQLGLKTEEDFKKHDTENLIIQFLRKNQLMKNLKSRTDAKSGNILVLQNGSLREFQPDNSELKYADEPMLRQAIEMINNIYAGVLLQPALEFDGEKFRDAELVQRSLYILNLLKHQMENMHYEYTLNNIYLALTKLDFHLKKLGVKAGVLLEVYGKEPSARRDNLLENIKQILTSKKMQKIEIDRSVTDGMEKEKVSSVSLKY